MKLTWNLKSMMILGQILFPFLTQHRADFSASPSATLLFFPCSCQSCNFSSTFPSPLHKSLSPFFLFSVKVPKMCCLSLSMLKVAVIAPHLGYAAAAMKFFGILVGGQVQTETMGIKHQGRNLAAGQSAAKWCCRYRESKTSWISWAPRYTLKPGQSQRH